MPRRRAFKKGLVFAIAMLGGSGFSSFGFILSYDGITIRDDCYDDTKSNVAMSYVWMI